MSDLTKMVENAKEWPHDSQILFATLEAMVEQIKHLEKRIKDAEGRHRRLLQSLEDDSLPRP